VLQRQPGARWPCCFCGGNDGHHGAFNSADFVLVDRDILALANGGHPEAIADTHVLATWFRGTKVYAGGTR